jgi:hypothetical protein
LNTMRKNNPHWGLRRKKDGDYFNLVISFAGAYQMESQSFFPEVEVARHVRDEILKHESILVQKFKDAGVYCNNERENIHQSGSQRIFREYLMEHLETILSSGGFDIKTFSKPRVLSDEPPKGSGTMDLDARKSLTGNNLSKFSVMLNL